MNSSFTATEYRFVNRETRSLGEYAKLFPHYDINRNAHALFLIEANIIRMSYGVVQTAIEQAKSMDHLIYTLEWMLEQKAYRSDEIFCDLREHAKAWDYFTTRFFTNDYSRDDLSRMASVLWNFSENHIKRGIDECDPGKPLVYLVKILERIRAEAIPILRREELYAMRVNQSVPLHLPEYSAPGFVSKSIAEELFLRAIQ